MQFHHPSAWMSHICGATGTSTPSSSPRCLACCSDAASDLLGKLRSGIFRLLLPVTPRVLPPVTNPPSNNETQFHRPPADETGRRRGGAVVGGGGGGELVLASLISTQSCGRRRFGFQRVYPGGAEVTDETDKNTSKFSTHTLLDRRGTSSEGVK